MKKSKILIFAAFAAAATINVGCSNEDVLESQPQKQSSNSIVVNATLDNQSEGRAIVTPALTKFQLFGFQGTNSITTDAVFAKSTTWTTSGTAAWGEASTAGNFYATSYDGSDAGPAVSSAGTFSYTVAGDYKDQKDLLVASATNITKNAAVPLAFKHGLANVNLKLRFNAIENGQPVFDEGYDDPSLQTPLITFDKIILHNIKMAGTYTFGTGWTPGSEYGDVTINFATPPIFTSYDAAVHSTYMSDVYVQNITLDKVGEEAAQSLFLLPQTISSENVWDSSTGVEAAESANLPYVEFHGVVYVPADPEQSEAPFDYTSAQLADEAGAFFDNWLTYDDDAGEQGWATSFYIPIKTITLDANKKYNLRLSVKDAVLADGSPALRLASIGGGSGAKKK